MASLPQPTTRRSLAVEQVSSRVLSRIGLFVLLSFAVWVYLGTTGALPLVGRDEPRYVQIGREMLQSGDWITPRLGGFTWFEKPVLLYWMVAASFGAFGASEWAARLGPALCGLGTAGLLWWMLRPLNERIARWSALACLCCGGMLVFAHGATFDVVLTFCLTLALAAWWRAHNEPQHERKFLALFWTGIGLAFMAKGLVAFLLPLATIAFYALVRRERVKVGFWWGLPLALLVSGIWYGPMIWVNGSKFLGEFFVQHHFERFVSDKYKHHQPFWYYLEILPVLSLPWTPLILIELWQTRVVALRQHSPEAGLKIFALAWMIVPVAFFSLSGSKLPGYILPAVPGAMLLAGIALEKWAHCVRRERVVMWGITSFFLLTLALLSIKPLVARADKKSVRRLFQAADAQGLGHVRVANYSSINRPAQFYAASHLLYGKDGEPLQLETPAQIRDLTRTQPLLLLFEDKTRPNLSGLNTQTVGDNGTTTLVLVRP